MEDRAGELSVVSCQLSVAAGEDRGSRIEDRDHSPLTTHRTRQRGFTLVEMLVAIVILMILAAMTVAVVNVAMDSDRLRSSARQVQSYLEGARDRAIFAQAPRGVRFLLDDTGILNGAGQPVTVTSMVFIGEAIIASDEDTRGTLRISHIDDTHPSSPPSSPSLLVEQVSYWDQNTNQPEAVGANSPTDPGTQWRDLAQNGVLTVGTRIRLINGSNEIWLAVDSRSFLPDPNNFTGTPPTPVNSNFLYLARPHPDYLAGTRDGYAPNATPPGPPPGSGTSQQYFGDGQHDLEYELGLAGSVVLANQDPVLLASGIVIDLEPLRVRGKLPQDWYRPANAAGDVQYGYIDVMFSPRGTVMRSSASRGVLHFLLAETEDVARRGEPGTPLGYVVGDPGINPGPPAPEVDGFIARDIDGDGQIDPEEEVTGDKVLVTVFTRTGHVSTNPIDGTDVINNANGNATPDGFADDPLSFAERGDVAR